MNINYGDGIADYDNTHWIALSCLFFVFVFHLMLMEIVIFITLFSFSLAIALARIAVVLYYFSHTTPAFFYRRCLVSNSPCSFEKTNFSQWFPKRRKTLKFLKSWHRTNSKSNDKNVSRFLWISHPQEEWDKENPIITVSTEWLDAWCICRLQNERRLKLL